MWFLTHKFSVWDGRFLPYSLHDAIVAGFKGFVNIYKNIQVFLFTDVSLGEFWEDNLTLSHEGLLNLSAELRKE